ncbi:hypothetical protein SAE01_32460 [Segetibacter aerophilus]|uniref:Uncharacterized protein n=1 Tax=Segetibacter aerophilus TaxID=670293 RepID=A0A512BFL6_9BACT|nr:hypothetical protein SAE01_32460 [Segetibacter aerophilus]
MEEQELTYTYNQLQQLIPKANHEELKQLTLIIYKERRLYYYITFSRTLRMITRRTLELTPTSVFLP